MTQEFNQTFGDMKFIRYFVRYTTVSNRFNFFLPVHLPKQSFFQIRVFNFRTRNLVEMKGRQPTFQPEKTRIKNIENSDLKDKKTVCSVQLSKPGEYLLLVKSTSTRSGVFIHSYLLIMMRAR